MDKMHKPWHWNEEKDAQLIEQRGLSFTDVLVAIEDGRVLADSLHPNPEKYPGQRVLVVNIDSYAYAVPYVDAEDERFMKTIYPSRGLTRKYLSKTP